MQIRSFRDLRVWHAAIESVDAIYPATASFPRNEIYGLTSQMQRAAVSVPSNIAEGHTRESTKEYLQHLSIAQASLAELETQIEIAKRRNYISEIDTSRLIESVSSLGRRLFALRNALINSKAKAMSPGS